MREVHPAAAMFPLISGKGFDELVADIKAKGLNNPIVLDSDGRVLDGRNRLAACERAGVEPTFTTYQGDDPIGFVVSQNMRRRDLTAGQRAALAADMRVLYAEEAKAREAERKRQTIEAQRNKTVAPAPQSESDKPRSKPAPKSRDHAAAVTGASARQVSRFEKLAKEKPELASKVRDGSMPLKTAEKAAKAKAPDAPKQKEPDLVEPPFDTDSWMPPDGGRPPNFLRTGPARAARIAWVRYEAERGHRPEDIAKDLGVGLEAVRRLAKDGGITFRVTSRTKKPNFDPDRLLDLLANDLRSMESTYIDRVKTHLAELDPARLIEHHAALFEGRTPITSLINRMADQIAANKVEEKFNG